jgi:2-methylisocitrate lyase-like PEP mutase family enzyme
VFVKPCGKRCGAGSRSLHRIIARTNAVRQVSFAEAVKRGNAYADAGADMIMALPRTAEEA